MLRTDPQRWDTGQEFSGITEAQFFGRTFEPELVLTAEDNNDYSRQKRAFDRLAECWDDIQSSVAEGILTYYEGELRFSYGPDDEDEQEKMWPEITSLEKLAEHLSLDSMIIPSADEMDNIYGGDTVFLCFSYSFGSDTDADGIGVRVTDNAVAEIGTQDIAF